MNINEINELRLILIKRSTDELEIMNKLIVEILAVRTKIATAKAKARWGRDGGEMDSAL